MPSLVKKMAKAYSRNATAEVKADHPKPPLRSSLRDCEEEDEDDEANRGRRDDLSYSRSPFYRQSPQTKPYSLSSGPLSRRASHASSASSSSFFDAAIQKLPVSPPIGSPVSDESSWEEQLSQIVTSAAVSEEIPSIHPSSHMKTLLLQLASTISALKTSFAQMKASARAGEPIKKSESAMEEELRRLSNLQIGMYELIQEYDLGSQGGPHAPQTCDSNMNNMPSDAEKQGMILKSYEGIIKRFHDEIRKKDAVTDALKETLAKTVLKSEKLEKRVKSLEAKLAAMELK